MNVDCLYSDKYEAVSHLSPTALYELAAPSIRRSLPTNYLKGCQK